MLTHTENKRFCTVANMLLAKIIIPNYVTKKQLIQEDFKSDMYKLKIFKFKIYLNCYQINKQI